ncbi:putative methyltransferase [Candidatus Nitrososphaera gargensis Ga9.2]|uniref:Putative methyltransferase n=1 Tax=Nitrososphaera gargensis (strain Ga9.2) TaxID=1237085 RepID=K0IIE4_NITGG|nr:methyltransferase domain-containing protein [Candidatus Nitrososphaera gargensis]AFU58768.1 putative methyltransferase [Candidatus Nitrososphaera gargensis Ga9.2]
MAQADLPAVMKARSAGFARLWGYSVGFYGVWLAHIGRQTGLLERIAHRPVSVDELVSATKMHPPAVQAWCSAAIAYGLVSEKKDKKMYLKPEMKIMLLDRKNPDYLGGQFSYLALRSLEYGAFQDLFRLGRTREMSYTLGAIEQATDWDHYSFLTAIRRDKKMSRLLSQGCRLLDVGCGTGSLLAKMCAEYPKSSFVGIDPCDKAVAAARKIAKGKPIKIIKQAGESMVFENEFDIVYLGESLYAARDKQKVVSNCRHALEKGGTIAIVEGLLPESRLHGDDSRLIMGMQLDFALQGYRFMTKKEVARLLAKFSRVRFKALGGSVYLVTAIK